MKFFDTHTHYDDQKFDVIQRKDFIASLFDGNIEYIVGASVDESSSYFQIAASEMFENYFAAVGIHPENCAQYAGNSDEALGVIEKLARHPKVVAIGETGLDFYWQDNPPREVQTEFFEKQLDMAERLGKPVIVHDREAHGAVFDILRRHPRVCGVMHSCSLSAEMALQLCRLGWYISFSGVVTYKNAVNVASVVKAIPEDRLLIETDCPYLPPVPYRGKTNNSSYIIHTAEKIAELRDWSLEKTAQITSQNAKRLFSV